MQTGEPNLVAMAGFAHLHRPVARHHLVRGAAHAQHRALLRRRPIDHGVPERPRARRRLHERGQLPRHRRPRRAVGLRRPDLLDRLPGRLAGRGVPDRGAAAQPRQVHLQRRRRVPPAAGAGARRGGGRQPRGRRVLPDRADGRRRQPDPAAVRPQLRDGGGDRRPGDARLRAVRRHDRDHVGADRQGGPAADRRLHAGDDGAGEFSFNPLALFEEATRQYGDGRARAGTLRLGSGRRHLARPGADVRHGGPAAHPDALLHRARRAARRACRSPMRPRRSAASTC